jgi:hypothetical protein
VSKLIELQDLTVAHNTLGHQTLEEDLMLFSIRPRHDDDDDDQSGVLLSSVRVND